TAAYEHFTDANQAKACVRARGAPIVVKADGLAAGKGVVVAMTEGEALAAVDMMFGGGLGEAGAEVVIEEFMEGEEASFFALCDGEHALPLATAQDHKRAFDGDKGPNTGGMGSYSCADFSLPFLTPEDVEAAKSGNQLIIDAIRAETGKPYRGVLYGNYMCTRSGLKLIEYNARFADPEALNILPLLETDFLDICLSVVENRLHTVSVQFEHKATVCKYVVPNGYPDKPVRDCRIELPSG